MADILDLRRKLDQALDLQQDLEEELQDTGEVSAPLALDYHFAHVNCLKAVGNYNSTRENCDLLKYGIPRPFPIELYLIRDAASRAYFPYKNELKLLHRRLEDTEREIKSLKRLIAVESRKPSPPPPPPPPPQGKLDL